ncbi:Monoacylglycerol lipase ABHD12 [Cytospora mali]|uniref:Monoacylglycerol lipase ABHD12 n=1 Tax=Cytospora mali TaxID=578113 RepID=A0A194UZH1_CYTMA|nr:Monoacylglycerol lipase ABHD12 [Valsa mali var. pyri (nom. inval.)]
MVSLQNKIIYAPYLPPTARFEKISDWQRKLFGIEWKELHMRSIDGTDLALAVASVSSEPDHVEVNHDGASHHVYILYLQGNASSLPPRLPDHSWILRNIRDEFKSRYPECGKVRFTQVGLSYRGYWTSAGRPNEIGINQDTIAATQWISQLHDNTYHGRDEDGQHKVKPIFIIWGQSIGSGFATNLATSGVIPAHFEPVALLLETPFLSIKEMLETIYPEKWLPYRYLHPFIRNHLDSYKNLGIIAEQRKEKGLRLPRIFILEAGRDEVVPPRHADELRKRCNELHLPVETEVVPKAFHSDAMIGRVHVAEFIMRQTARVIGTDH